MVSLFSDVSGLVPLFIPVTMGTIRAATGLLILIVGLLLWGKSEKTTKQHRRGVFLIGIGLIMLIVIPAINLIFWLGSLT